jgi:predicted transcriptional regulator of viral defense system
MYVPLIEDRVLVELHRAAALAGRPGIVVPSVDLEVADQQTGSRARTKDAISRLAKANKILAVRKDLLVLPDATGRATVSVPELVDVVAPPPYLITGGRALQHHHLTDQHFFSVAVLVPRRVSTFMYRGERAVFLATDPKQIWGWQGEERPRFATPERVILDVLSSPRYGVSFSQVLSALSLAVQRDPEFLVRLVASVRRFESDAAARRVGLLVDRLFGPDSAAPFRELIGKSRTPVLLRRGGNTEGQVDLTWRVVVNASTEPECRPPR